MRHNQNGRRFRGRNDGGGGGGGQRHHSGGGGGGGHHHHNNGGGNRRVNPRVQTFDSNGPDVRIRGNAYQINEKYVALARDANSAGDRVLAESYLQHAEHYLRMINEMTDEYNKQNPQQHLQPQSQPITGEEPQPELSVEQPSAVAAAAQQQQQAQPSSEGMDDLDQSFLRPRAKEVENA
jgi:Domain of unknown function (DUF4167)